MVDILCCVDTYGRPLLGYFAQPDAVGGGEAWFDMPGFVEWWDRKEVVVVVGKQEEKREDKLWLVYKINKELKNDTTINSLLRKNYINTDFNAWISGKW